VSKLLRFVAIAGAPVAALGVAVYAVAVTPQKALVYCPVAIDSIGCDHVVAALSGPNGLFPNGVDRGYDGTAGTVDLATADLSPYAVFIVPSLADDSLSKPYDLLRNSRIAYRLSVALQGRLIVWSGTPDQGTQNRDLKDKLIRNLAVWARGADSASATGLVVLGDHSEVASQRYAWLTGFAGLAVSPDTVAQVYDSVNTLTATGIAILDNGGTQLAYPAMASFGVQPPQAASGAAVAARGGSGDGQVVLVTSPQRLASVKTDKPDYSPGETVTFTGSGWKPGEVVTLVLHEDPWFDDHPVLTATADESGNISNNQFVPDEHDVNVQFSVTASGQTSGLVAQATFTDAALPSNVKLQQWETLPTGNWTTGNLGSSNSDYAEGEVVPFRLDVGGLATSGNPYTFSVCRDFQSGTKRGYLFLAPFNTSRAAAPGGTITSTNGPFNGVNVTINSVTEVGGQGGCGTGQRETGVSVNSTGNATAFVLWGGHLAAPGDVFEGQPVGPGNGAASFPGSNLHMNLLSPNKSVTINPGAVKPAKATPALATTPTPTSGTVGVTLNDAATLSGGSSPTGSITFTLYDPDQATCTGTPRFTQTVTVTGNGTYSTTGGFVTDKPGTWRWTASYSGDASNNPASTGCNDEQVAIGKATPALTTTASGSVAAGGQVSDVAHLTLGTNPTGTISFTLYSDAGCTISGSVFTSSATVNGNGDYSSGNFTATQAGTYHWRASYSGDPNNNPAGPTACADPAEAVVVTKASPTVTTSATPQATAGGTISDQALLAGSSGPNATGTISFTVFGPNNATCALPGTPAGSAVVSGDGTYPSSAVPVVLAGAYRWIASYSGDVNNNGFTTACNAPNETSVVSKASPTVTTSATPQATAGGTISDQALLAGSSGPNATGTISFTVFGPNNATCALPGTPAGSAVVSGDGTYPSSAVPVVLAGAYRWIASYSGDVNNNGFTTACNAPNETSVVSKASPTVTTSATPQATAGGTISDQALLAGSSGPNATGTISFTVFGPNNATCALPGTPAGSAVVSGDGTYPSSPVPVNEGGAYRWIASYSGDVNNNGFTTACNAPNETSVVIAQADLSITKTDNPDPVNAGATLTYTVTVTNGGPSTAANVQVTDNLPAGVTFQSASGTGWTCVQAGGVVTCTRGIVAPGGAPPITITVTPAICGTITNRATVSSTTIDPNAANNTATENTTVQCLPGKVTGGGEIRVPKGSNGKDFANFGFVVQRMMLNGPAIGQLQYHNHARLVDVHSTGMLTLLIVGNTATFSGTCTKRVGNGNPGMCTFTVWVEDNGNPGANRDKFTIAVSGEPVEGSMSPGGQPIIRGNIKIQSGGILVSAP